MQWAPHQARLPRPRPLRGHTCKEAHSQHNPKRSRSRRSNPSSIRTLHAEHWGRCIHPRVSITHSGTSSRNGNFTQLQRASRSTHLAVQGRSNNHNSRRSSDNKHRTFGSSALPQSQPNSRSNSSNTRMLNRTFSKEEASRRIRRRSAITLTHSSSSRATTAGAKAHSVAAAEVDTATAQLVPAPATAVKGMAITANAKDPRISDTASDTGSAQSQWWNLLPRRLLQLLLHCPLQPLCLIIVFH
jgi:hypothetical protein